MPKLLCLVHRAWLCLCVALVCAFAAHAQSPEENTGPLQALLQEYQEAVARPSRGTIRGVLDALLEAELPGTVELLRTWADRNLFVAPDGRFFYTREGADRTLTLIDIDTGADIATATAREMSQIRPNAGVRQDIASALVQFELSGSDPVLRRAAVDAIARAPDASHIPLIAASLEDEDDPALALRKERLLQLLLARFADDPDARVGAIGALAGDVSTEARRTLNQILATDLRIAETLPEGVNIARIRTPGAGIGRTEAYDLLVAAGLASARPERNAVRDALRAHIVEGAVGGVPLAELSNPEARLRAHGALVAQGLVPALVTQEAIDTALAGFVFFDEYREPDARVTTAARDAIDSTRTRIMLFQGLSISLDALSLASIFFLAAIGLAITFGVMGVINMAHGEFIMMGAYTGYVVQLFIPDYTLSLIVALPLAFAVTFAAGVGMERSVIRHLYKRPLETLLATFGISIALQQLAKIIFGTQARPLTAPDWLAGAIAINDVVSLATIRVGIFVLAVLFLLALLFLLKRTRLGLEVRAVTQNPGMAASMGINPDRINMLTFGLGSGIAGVAGVAIGLYAQVTSEMGSNYIVQSFMTVVVGGVGNVWGTLAGAGLIGFLQKGIEWFNPSNTLAAQTFMVLFIILFIQFRPRGIIALKGRAAGD